MKGKKIGKKENTNNNVVSIVWLEKKREKKGRERLNYRDKYLNFSFLLFP